MANIFFSYSHKDESLRDELEKHLTILKRQGHIEAWHDRRIVVGENLDQEIDQNLKTADIILLLISSDFLASDYCYDIEMTQAIKRQDSGEAKVISIILRPCAWKDAPFAKLLVTPTDGKPVTKFPTLDDGFLEVTEAIKAALKQLGRPKIFPKQNDLQVSAISPESVIHLGPRSSNLRIKKEFTDRERDSFLAQSYEFIANYFEGSLQELEKRNSNVETDYRRIDAIHFIATVYLDGKQKSRCKIWLGGSQSLAGGIAYSDMNSFTVQLDDNSFNESLSVASDDHALFLQPMGMMSFPAPNEKKLLTSEGAGEYLWAHFIAPLQH
jgi:hypothetical protein